VANDRIWIECPVCKKQRLLYKYYPAGGYTWTPDEEEDFLDTHIHECGKKFDGSLNGDPFFRLVTESQPDA
jgi:hypothetical protein